MKIEKIALQSVNLVNYKIKEPVEVSQDSNKRQIVDKITLKIKSDNLLSEKIRTLKENSQEQAKKLEDYQKQITSGNVVSKNFNKLINVFNGNQDETKVAVENALDIYKNKLSPALQKLEDAVAENDSEKIRETYKDLQVVIKEAQKLDNTANKKMNDLLYSNKFWSGLTAELTSSIIVTGVSSIVSKKIGLPVNIKTLSAGFALGGTVNIGMNALLDNQFTSKECLTKFVSGGLGAATLVFSTKPGINTATKIINTQAVSGGIVSGTGVIAKEAQEGFKDGWQKRVIKNTVIGSATGAVMGYAGTKTIPLIQKISDPFVSKGAQIFSNTVSSSAGAVGASAIMEWDEGFKEGWEKRLKQQALGGAISGFALSFTPTVSGTQNKDVKDEIVVNKTKDNSYKNYLEYESNKKLQEFDKKVTDYSHTHYDAYNAKQVIKIITDNNSPPQTPVELIKSVSSMASLKEAVKAPEQSYIQPLIKSVSPMASLKEAVKAPEQHYVQPLIKSVSPMASLKEAVKAPEYPYIQPLVRNVSSMASLKEAVKAPEYPYIQPLIKNVSSMASLKSYTQQNTYNTYVPLINLDGTNLFPSMKEKFYSNIFLDDKLRDKTVEMFTSWTSTYSSNDIQSEMRKSWSNVIKGNEPSNQMESNLMDIYTTRKERWQRLAEKLDIPVPEGFQLYRGVNGDDFVQSVIEGWKDNKSDNMQIPVHELSSWSLKRETAQGFAWDQRGSVIFDAYVPFERTLADKFVDDGNFITAFSHENEVVVAISEANSLAIPKDQITVNYKNKTYTYDQRDELIKAYETPENVSTVNNQGTSQLPAETPGYTLPKN